MMEGGPEGSHRYRFSWEGIDVQIDGTPGMIDQIRRKLGLADVGWVIQRPIEPTTVQPASMARTGPDVPAPDPGRIPVVRRPVGSLDLDAALAKVGLEPPRRPTSGELREVIDQLDGVQIIDGAGGADPLAEAWLRELMTVAVRRYGVTALSTSTIEEAASHRLGDRTGMELEIWLETLFRMQRLIKVHAGSEAGWGPEPAWLEGRL